MATSFFTEEQLQQLEQNAVSDSRYVKISKIKEGEPHRYRYFGTSITGFEGWLEAETPTPVRYELHPEEVPSNLRPDMNGKKSLKFFVAGVVWDYQDEAFKILLLTQKTLIDKLRKYSIDSDFGDPVEYDIKITRTVKNDRTSYELMAAPPKPAAKAIQAAYEQELNCDLRRLFDNEDPFADPTA